jgi:hypothetical protein
MMILTTVIAVIDDLPDIHRKPLQHGAAGAFFLQVCFILLILQRTLPAGIRGYPPDDIADIIGD